MIKRHNGSALILAMMILVLSAMMAIALLDRAKYQIRSTTQLLKHGQYQAYIHLGELWIADALTQPSPPLHWQWRHHDIRLSVQIKPLPEQPHQVLTIITLSDKKYTRTIEKIDRIP